jgi:hypothetical protein
MLYEKLAKLFTYYFAQTFSLIVKIYNFDNFFSRSKTFLVNQKLNLVDHSSKKVQPLTLIKNAYLLATNLFIIWLLFNNKKKVKLYGHKKVNSFS